MTTKGIIVAVLAGVILLAAATALADIKRYELIPESLRGQWSAGADSCGTDKASIIELSANGYERAGEKCAVEWVDETPGRGGSIYSARLRCAPGPAGSLSRSVLLMRPQDADRV